MRPGTCASLGLLLLFSVCPSVHLTEVVLDTGNSTESQLASAIRALNSALHFFHQEYRNVNLDAIIGTRTVEGSLTVLLNRLDSSGQSELLPKQYIRNIRALRDLAGTVSELATPYVALKYPHYYKRIGAILSKGFWELDYPSRDLSSSMVIWPHRNHEAMREKSSDLCLSELFGTGEKTTQTCRISDRCWDMMTKPGYSGYSLSHEVFYLEIAERFGCLPQVLTKILMNRQPSVTALREAFCANMFEEAKLIEIDGFMVHRRDLFMENAALCGMLGYRDFFNSDWLEKILSWQTPGRGCYVASPLEVFPHDDVELEQSEEIIDNKSLKKRNASTKSRVKREEKKLPDGCLCHRTTVAAGALAQYVRYITEVWVMEKEQQQ
ncbi:UPF0764 protein C16orf89 homolog [Gigantopelta aegis]|uniref:UPF0764 protein C16orf89 homolog n=1 Tax=Gigantopelta aegis TaxID=1735272 RepID=UPI001B88DCD5|nr:UPF0764 protein C16orf89 homolog [Gigantopelta aegis]